MSDPALNAAIPLQQVQLQQAHAQQVQHTNTAAAAQQVAVSAAAATSEGRDISAEDLAAGVAAQAGLDDMLASEAPDDASIGLYNEDVGSAQQVIAANSDAANQQVALNADLQADAVAQQQVLTQDLNESSVATAEMLNAVTLKESSAVAAIDQSLASGVAEAKLNAFAADLNDLLQAVETGAPQAAALAADQLQAGLGSPDAPPANAFAPPPTVAVAVAASNAAVQMQSLMASAQSGDLAEAAAQAQSLRAQVAQIQGMITQPPPLSAAISLISTPPLSAAAMGLLMLDLDVNPLLLVFQASLLLGVKTTLNAPRRPLDDHIAIVAIPALGQLDLHEDDSKDD